MSGFTVGDLIRSSMRKIGVLAAGEPLPAEEGADAKQTLINMIDAWTLETLLVPVVGVVTHTLVVGEPQYTIGVYPSPQPVPLPDNHIETARPEKVISSFIRDGSGTDYAIDTLDVSTYADISRKANSSRPSAMYTRKGWPLNTLIFDSAPYDAETLHLEVIQPLSEVLPAAGLTDVINLPPGYKRTLEYNLAIDLADEWGKKLSPVVAAIAGDGKRWIKRANYRPIVLDVDSALLNNGRGRGTYDISSGP